MKFKVICTQKLLDEETTGGFLINTNSRKVYNFNTAPRMAEAVAYSLHALQVHTLGDAYKGVDINITWINNVFVKEGESWTISLMTEDSKNLANLYLEHGSSHANIRTTKDGDIPERDIIEFNRWLVDLVLIDSEDGMRYMAYQTMWDDETWWTYAVSSYFHGFESIKKDQYNLRFVENNGTRMLNVSGGLHINLDNQEETLDFIKSRMGQNVFIDICLSCIGQNDPSNFIFIHCDQRNLPMKDYIKSLNVGSILFFCDKPEV